MVLRFHFLFGFWTLGTRRGDREPSHLAFVTFPQADRTMLALQNCCVGAGWLVHHSLAQSRHPVGWFWPVREEGEQMCEPHICLLAAVSTWPNHLVFPIQHLLIDSCPISSIGLRPRDPRLFLSSQDYVSPSFLYIITGEDRGLSQAQHDSEKQMRHFCSWVWGIMFYLPHWSPWELWPRSPTQSMFFSLSTKLHTHMVPLQVRGPLLPSRRAWSWSTLVGVPSQHLRHFCHCGPSHRKAHLSHWSLPPPFQYRLCSCLPALRSPGTRIRWQDSSVPTAASGLGCPSWF